MFFYLDFHIKTLIAITADKNFKLATKNKKKSNIKMLKNFYSQLTFSTYWQVLNGKISRLFNCKSLIITDNSMEALKTMANILDSKTHNGYALESLLETQSTFS